MGYFYCHCPDFCEKSNLRWRIVGNLLPNRRTQARSSMVIHSLAFALIWRRPCLTLHPPVSIKITPWQAGWIKAVSARLTNPSCHGITLFVAEFAAYNFIYQFHKIKDITNNLPYFSRKRNKNRAFSSFRRKNRLTF